jgi:hypothetical protein
MLVDLRTAGSSALTHGSGVQRVLVCLPVDMALGEIPSPYLWISARRQLMLSARPRMTVGGGCEMSEQQQRDITLMVDRRRLARRPNTTWPTAILRSMANLNSLWLRLFSPVFLKGDAAYAFSSVFSYKHDKFYSIYTNRTLSGFNVFPEKVYILHIAIFQMHFCCCCKQGKDFRKARFFQSNSFITLVLLRV